MPCHRPRATATTIDPDDDGHRYGWGENIGWVNMWGDGGNGVAVRSDPLLHGLQGYAWLENAGWVNFGGGSPAMPPFYSNASADDCGVNLDTPTGTLSGFAWCENIGWINFEPGQLHGEMVRIDPLTGLFSGRAWGENVGWISFTGVGVADVAKTLPGFAQWRDDEFTTGAVVPPGGDGWTSFGFNTPGFAWPDYDSGQGAYRCWVKADPARFRISGLITNPPDWVPYNQIGPDRVVRAKYYIFAGGMPNPSDMNQVPNLRLRLANRYAVDSLLEVFHHDPGDPANAALAAELRPSVVATSPSLYRVDFKPVAVPYLASNGGFEGVQRGFEAYAIHPTDSGYIALTESVIGTYPASLISTSTSAWKIYATDPGGPGDLGIYAVPQSVELSLANLYFPPGSPEGTFASAETTGPIPTYFEGATGVMLDAAVVPTDRIGVGTRNFNPDRGTSDYAARVRVDEGVQYVIRFHATSTQSTNRQSQVRLRARSIKFAWSQKFEVGGAWATDGGKTYPLNQNNSIAQQALPGGGSENPDRMTGGEPGGWYTMILHSPMSREIRPEFPSDTILQVRMPNITAQPGPGAADASRRDVMLGLDLVDTLSAGAGRFLEHGNVNIDRIEVRSYSLVAD